MFTAGFALDPYIKQRRFVFKGLMISPKPKMYVYRRPTAKECSCISAHYRTLYLNTCLPFIVADDKNLPQQHCGVTHIFIHFTETCSSTHTHTHTHRMHSCFPTATIFTQKHATVPCLWPCHHGMARPQVADGGTASDMVGSCE